MLAIQTLPENEEKLKAIIGLQFQQHAVEIQSFRDIIQSKDEQLAARDRWIEILQESLRLSRMARFAAQSEKLPSDQCELFNEPEKLEAQAVEAVSEVVETLTEVPAHTRGKPKRKPLPEHLPREEVIVDLLESEKICSKDNTPLKLIGEEVSEALDVIPAKFKVIRTIRKKYACPCCEEGVKTAALPERILPKTNATPGLLAYIAVSKYVDALPLYRLEQMFKRSAVELPRNTMASWMIALSEKLQPIYNLMQDDLLASDYVCCDETRVQVLHENGKPAESLSYMWVRSRHGPGVSPIVLFDYDPTRSKEVPNRLLAGFKGYLQADGYAGYDEVCASEDVTRLGCMAHARRKFFDAFKTSGKKPDSASDQVLKLIQGLYKIEEAIKERSIAERKEVRDRESTPILDKIKTFLDKNENSHPPQGLMGKAITYARNQWAFLMNYLKDGRLSIDNNFTENRIRPFAVGRKNWLFSDTVAGAEASAMIYSILQTARGNGLEPYAYMRYLLTELPKANPVIEGEIEKLLPHKIDPKVLEL